MSNNKRYDLQGILENITPHVYFQPPTSPLPQLVYPCIVYTRNSDDTQYADNKPYIYKQSYRVIVIDSNPDSLIPMKVAMLPTSRHERTYSSDNLYHYVYNIYY